MKLLSASCAVVAFSASASAAYAGWYGASGVQINNIIALVGGSITTGNFSNGRWSTGSPVANTGPIYRRVDLSQPFAAGVDPETLLIANQTLTDDSSVPNTINGAIFHNDISWYTFGGQVSKNRPSILNTSVYSGTLFGNNKGLNPSQARTQADGDGGVWENIAASAFASSGDPLQQGRGWLFGGMAKDNHAIMRYPVPVGPGPNDTMLASDVFYQADMKTSAIHVTFSTLQSPLAQINGLKPRAAGGLVWLPFGQAGILVALGGVQYPADFFLNKPAVASTNNTYMKDLLVFDIQNNQWYSQTTQENGPNPGQLASFCTAVVPSRDGYSQHIIVYGGWDGTAASNVVDDVWILSVPAFQWTQVYQSKTAAHGRKGSVCFAPNPTTFISIGGSSQLTSYLDSDVFIDIFNLTSLSWGSRYDPSSNQSFSAPAKLVSQLQWPNADGPGSISAANINNQALRSVLNTAYPRSITPSYPYASPNATVALPPSTSSAAPAKGKHSNTALIASLATVIPVVIIAALIAIFCLRRRKHRKNQTRGKDSDVSSWVRKVDRDEKSNGYTESTVVNSPYEDFGRSPVIPAVARKNNDIYEADHANTLTPAFQSPDHLSHKQADKQYFELDNDPRGPTALSSHPANINGQQSDIRSELGSDKHASELPQASSRENLSVPAGGVVAGTSQPSSISRKPVADRRDSTPLPSPATPNMGHTRGTSDVSSAALTASPNTEMRRSQYIDGLPEQPGHLGEGRLTPTTQGRASAYKENI